MSRHRLALYSPGMVGLGHVRRNLLIAQSLSSVCDATVLLLAEAREAGALAMPPGVDCLTLPAIRKNPDGTCHPRHLAGPLERVVSVRSRTIDAALRAFDPDLLVVDHLPFGACGELSAALKRLKARGRARCVLGLRDVLESPEVVHTEWRRRRYDEAIESVYDAVWVYGDPRVFDPIREYGLTPAVARKLRFTGYLDTRIRLRCESMERAHLLPCLGLDGAGRVALCLVGGGSDGGPLAEAFLESALPPNALGVVLTGPFMPPEMRRRLYQVAAARPGRRVLDFVSEPAFLVDMADWIVTMGGYNNVCDVLSFEKRALVVPRTTPGSEQLIRAERLRDRGLVDVLLPEQASPHAIGEWLQDTEWLRDTQLRPVGMRSRPDLHALRRLPALTSELLAGGHPAQSTHPTGEPGVPHVRADVGAASGV